MWLYHASFLFSARCWFSCLLFTSCCSRASPTSRLLLHSSSIHFHALGGSFLSCGSMHAFPFRAAFACPHACHAYTLPPLPVPDNLTPASFFLPTKRAQALPPHTKRRRARGTGSWRKPTCYLALLFKTCCAARCTAHACETGRISRPDGLRTEPWGVSQVDDRVDDPEPDRNPDRPSDHPLFGLTMTNGKMASIVYAPLENGRRKRKEKKKEENVMCEEEREKKYERREEKKRREGRKKKKTMKTTA